MLDVARLFRALGDPTRLRLVVLLTQQEPGRCRCVRRLARELGVTTPAVSQHLRVLKDLGLVRGERLGYRIHYFLDEEHLASYWALARRELGESFVLGVIDPLSLPAHETTRHADDESAVVEETPKPADRPTAQNQEWYGEGMRPRIRLHGSERLEPAENSYVPGEEEDGHGS